MASFPVLKTGSIMQYPARKAIVYGTGVLRFIDGKEQRTRESGSALRRWVVDLSLIDESEMAALDAFFVEQNGAAGVFSFTDPWDGTVYSNCSLESDDYDCVLEAPGRARLSLVIRENRT